MKPSDLTSLLRDFCRDKLALRERHIAGARHVSHFDFNNTYQYVINREDAQVAWLQEALRDLGAEAPAPAPALAVPSGGRGDAAQQAIIADDVRHARAFVERWEPRLTAVTHARHRNMLRVIVGETLEHERFFDQMAKGCEDVLGRRGGERTGGGVLPVRWLKQ